MLVRVRTYCRAPHARARAARRRTYMRTIRRVRAWHRTAARAMLYMHGLCDPAAGRRDTTDTIAVPIRHTTKLVQSYSEYTAVHFKTCTAVPSCTYRGANPVLIGGVTTTKTACRYQYYYYSILVLVFASQGGQHMIQPHTQSTKFSRSINFSPGIHRQMYMYGRTY
eukprot:SAG31_NODE_126_length_23665_cov_6.178987_13_plen_167_part_00